MYDNTLHAARLQSSEAVVRLLLDHGAVLETIPNTLRQMYWECGKRWKKSTCSCGECYVGLILSTKLMVVFNTYRATVESSDQSSSRDLNRHVGVDVFHKRKVLKAWVRADAVNEMSRTSHACSKPHITTRIPFSKLEVKQSPNTKPCTLYASKIPISNPN